MYLANQACQCLSAYRHCHLWIQKKTREPQNQRVMSQWLNPKKSFTANLLLTSYCWTSVMLLESDLPL